MGEMMNRILYTNDNSKKLVLERLTTVYEPSDPNSKEQCTYPKIIRLEHSGENNGTLIVTRETVWAPDSRYPVYRSTDDGETWSKISLVGDDYNERSIPGYQPYLYEIPADMGEFKKGTLLMAACTRIPETGGQKTIMTLFYSTDIGENWKAFCNVDVGGKYNSNLHESEGLWEPLLIYEEETGRMYCFYSDELDPMHSQRLVYKYSTDLVNWSEKYECVACEDRYLRPGMIAITKMGNGKYALVFEMYGLDACPVYIKFADKLDDWGDISDYGRFIANSEGKGMGSAPAAAWTPDGGECGTLLVTAHHSVNGVSNTKCDLFLSFDYGETFVSIDNPIPNRHNPNIRSGYSPGFFISEDHSIYYVNNPEREQGSTNEKLMFAKMKIY